MFHRTPLGRFDEGRHNCVSVADSLLRRSARLPFEFHLVGKDFVDMSWSAGLEVAPMFEKAFRARSVRCEKLRIAIQWNRLLDGVKDARSEEDWMGYCSW
jgi:hypothetical protein